MKISEVKVKLTGNDILGIINEFIKIDGVILEKVLIEDGIILQGSFNKGFKMDFHVKAQILKCSDNKIIARISKMKILNLGIFRIFRSFASKQLLKAFSNKGIYNENDKVIININTLLKDIPFININIEDLFIKKSELWIEANNVSISTKGSLINRADEEEVLENSKEENIEELEFISKVNDNYSRGRKIIEDKLPRKTRKYKDYVFVLPDIISLIYRLLKDKRVPVKTKLLISSAIAYITIPTDILPDSIPFIGRIDDVGVLFFTLNKILKDIPLSIIIENWQGENDILIVLKRGIEYFINFTGAKNVETLYSVVEELST